MQQIIYNCVEQFWDTNICGAHFVPVRYRTREFFEQYYAYRYRTEWHLPEMVQFDKFIGKEVLEIGCGIGADGRRFAEKGARYTGIDLTEEAVETCRKHFETFSLEGKFQKVNAECMTFQDNVFDLVYSHGVLHHTPSIATALTEIYRVLKPGGDVIIMLYNRNSVNYYVRIMMMLWFSVRLYVLVRPLLPLKMRPSSFELHHSNYLRIGNEYFRPSEFTNHCTDGVQCPIARVYSKKEAMKLFGKFTDLKFRIAHFPLKKYWKHFPSWFEKFMAKRYGWYLFIYGRKPV